MKLSTIAVLAFHGVATAIPLESRQQGGGDGPFKPVRYTTDSSLSQHTIYMPSGSTGSAKLPVLVWGNGGCGGDGTSNANFLSQVASYGYLAISSGAPRGSQSTTAAMMTASIDWVVKNAGKGAYASVDSSKIMAAGYSCGGVEAMAQIWDSRVKTVGIFSSGLLSNQTAAKDFRKPLLYVMGGSGDGAYPNAERDYKALPADTPAWKGNLPLGHGGDLSNANGGRFGKAGLNWLEWLFKGNTTAGAYFTGNGYKADQWTVETHALNLLKPFN